MGFNKAIIVFFGILANFRLFLTKKSRQNLDSLQIEHFQRTVESCFCRKFRIFNTIMTFFHRKLRKFLNFTRNGIFD